MRPETTYYLFGLLIAIGIGSSLTLYIPWLESIGLSYAQVPLLNLAFWAGVLLLEVPTGMIADGRGRGWSLRAGAFVYAIGGFGYFFVTGFWGAMVAEAFLSLGRAFISGALSAWIMDAPNRSTSTRQIFATQTAIQGVAMVISPMIAVQVVNLTSPSFFWIMLSMAHVLAALLAWRFMQGSEPEHPMAEFEALRHAVQHLRTSPTLRWAVAAHVVLALMGAVNMFWALLFLSRITPVELTWVWTAMYVSLAGAGWLVRTRFADAFQGSIGMMLAMSVAFVPLALVGVFPWTIAWVVLIVLNEFGRGAFQPFAQSFVHERVESGYRATFGSLQSLCSSVGMGLTLLGSAVFMHFAGSSTESILLLWTLVGILGLLMTALLWSVRPNGHDA